MSPLLAMVLLALFVVFSFPSFLSSRRWLGDVAGHIRGGLLMLCVAVGGISGGGSKLYLVVLGM